MVSDCSSITFFYSPKCRSCRRAVTMRLVKIITDNDHCISITNEVALKIIFKYDKFYAQIFYKTGVSEYEGGN